jgi:hypothetical protein
MKPASLNVTHPTIVPDFNRGTVGIGRLTKDAAGEVLES